jgi:hypothetical protein
MKKISMLVVVALAACSSGPGPGEEAKVVAKAKPRVNRAGFGGPAIPAERDGIRADDTGAIMFICANSTKHEDKEVFVHACACGEKDYFHWDGATGGFVCFACTKAFPNEKVVCPDCGSQPRRVRTRVTTK